MCRVEVMSALSETGFTADGRACSWAETGQSHGQKAEAGTLQDLFLDNLTLLPDLLGSRVGSLL